MDIVRRAPFFDLFGPLFGLVYGAIIAGTYMLMKHVGNGASIGAFGLASLVVFLIHLIYLKGRLVNILNERAVIFRGVLFAGTQCLLLIAQEHGSTSTTLMASVVGNLIGVTLGRYVLKESFNKTSVIALAVCIAGTLFQRQIFNITYFAVIAGCLQGGAGLLVRSMMQSRISIPESVAVGFGLSSVCSLILAGVTKGSSGIPVHEISTTLAIALGATLAQYGFFLLYRWNSVQNAAVYSLGRIPWAMSLERLFFGAGFSSQQIASGLLIVCASMVLILEKTFKRMINKSLVQAA